MRKKMVSVLLSVLICLSAAVFNGCNTKKIDPNDPNKLEVYIYNAGYGYKWAEDILNAFKQEEWVKEKYPDLKTSFTQDAAEHQSKNLMSGPKSGNKYDVVFGTWLYDYMGTNKQALDLSETVYNSVVPGESILFKDKLMSSYVESAAYSGTQSKYYVAWASGMGGLYYNKTRVENLFGSNVKLNTTNEFIQVMQDMKNLNGSNPNYNATTSFATYGNSDYGMYLYNTWWAQYETAEEYKNYYNGIDSSTESRSPVVFSQTGRRKSLEVMESFLTKNKGFVQVSNNTGKEAYLETQNRVILGTSLFMANGDWVDNETRKLQGATNDVTTTLRTPIISSIIEKTPSIPDDATLSAVVAAIDAGETSYAGVDDEDFQIILEARRIVYSIGSNHHVVIPSYASGKEPAIDFIRYLATDKAIEIYMDVTNGASLPFKYDVETKNPQLFNRFSTLQQDRIKYFNDIEVYTLPSEYSYRLARLGGVTVFKSEGDNPLPKFTTNAETASMLIKNDIKYWTESNNNRWNQALIQAGLK